MISVDGSLGVLAVGIELEVTHIIGECVSLRDEVNPDPPDVMLGRVRVCDLFADRYS